jgi:uncharacterized protein
MGTIQPFGCVKNTIRLRSGLYFDFIDPQQDQFTLEDIAGALSKICRFGGQIDRFYSVAEHCVHCAEQGRKDGLGLVTQQALLLHDAAEAFCGDVVKPLKIMLLEYENIERRVGQVIEDKFLLDFQAESSFVREIDHAMLIAERRELFSADDVVWAGEKEVRVIRPWLECWMPEQAEAQFLKTAKELDLAN